MRDGGESKISLPASEVVTCMWSVFDDQANGIGSCSIRC